MKTIFVHSFIITCAFLSVDMHSGVRSVTVRRFQREDQTRVADLYRHSVDLYADVPGCPEVGAMTRWFTDKKLEEDMKDIYAHYLSGGDEVERCFFVAIVELDSGEQVIAGCVGVTSTTDFPTETHIELVRMAVDGMYRRFGIGTALVFAVAEFAKSIGKSFIGLSTLEVMAPATAFYERQGFQLQRKWQLNPSELLHRTFDTENEIFVVYYSINVSALTNR